MQKDNIKLVFERYIQQSLQHDEIHHLRNEHDNPHNAANAVTGLDMRLSEYTDALSMNDFQLFAEDAVFFINEHFPNHRLKSDDKIYRVLVREYLKATAYCIQISINRLRGDYFNETSCSWMPDHLGSLQEVETDRTTASAFSIPPGRPSRNWDAIKAELNTRHKAGQLMGMSRTAISSDLADWYDQNHESPVRGGTIRKKLKETFDDLGI